MQELQEKTKQNYTSFKTSDMLLNSRENVISDLGRPKDHTPRAAYQKIHTVGYTKSQVDIIAIYCKKEQ